MSIPLRMDSIPLRLHDYDQGTTYLSQRLDRVIERLQLLNELKKKIQLAEAKSQFTLFDLTKQLEQLKQHDQKLKQQIANKEREAKQFSQLDLDSTLAEQEQKRQALKIEQNRLEDFQTLAKRDIYIQEQKLIEIQSLNDFQRLIPANRTIDSVLDQSIQEFNKLRDVFRDVKQSLL